MQKVLIVNVLSPETYADCHIPGSVNVPLANLERESKLWNKDQSIIVYCANYECPAGNKAWHLLDGLGFKNVREYEGGMNEWYQKKYPVQGSCKAEYLKKPVAKTEGHDGKVKTITHEALKKLIS